MTSVFKTSFIFIVAILITQLGTIRGKWKEMTAPRMHVADVATVSASVDQQRQSLVDYSYKVCQAFNLCAGASTRHDKSEVKQACQKSADQISAIHIPNILPASVRKNIEVYHQSMINGSINISNAWDIAGKDGGTFWTYVFNWEIDTCGDQSIPQNIYRLYDLQKISNVKVITCNEIERLYRNRTPSSDK